MIIGVSRRAIESTRKGDVDAFRPIVERFQNMAVGYAWSILGDAQLAEDAAQEAFLVAFLNDALSGSDPDGDALTYSGTGPAANK